MIRNVLAIAGKELLVLLKNRGALVVLFLLPVVLASMFGSMASSFEATEEGEAAVSMPVVLINHDEGAYGKQVAAILQRIDALEITPLASVEQANERIADRKALAAIVIPAQFSARVDAHEPSKVQVIVDPTQEQYAGMVTGIMNEVLAPIVLQGEIQYGIRAVMDRSGLVAKLSPELRRATEAQTLGVIMTQLQKQQESPWIAVRHEDPEGVEAKGPWNPFTYNFPSMTAMFAFFLVGMMAQALWVEKEQGSFRRLLAAPIHRGAIIAGKMVAYMLVVCLQVVVFFTIANAVFGMPLGDSPLGLAGLTLGLALSAAGLGMLVAAVSRSSRQAESMGMLLAFVLAAAGGCIGFPLFRLEGIIGTVSRLTPQAQATMGFMDLLGGASLIQILPQIGMLAAIGVVFFGIAMWRFRFE